MSRVGVRLIATLGVALGGGFIGYTLAPAGGAVSAVLHADLPREGQVGEGGADVRLDVPVRLASLNATGGFAAWWPSGNPLQSISARASFGERFGFVSQNKPESPQPAQTSWTLEDRFKGEDTPFEAPSRSASAAEAPKPSVMRAVAAPRSDTRSTGVRGSAKRPADGKIQLASASETPVVLGYAPGNPAKNSAPNPLSDLAPKDSDPTADIDTSRTAIYDISSRTVYLPNGRRLEAHSGLGSHMDDVRYVHMRMTGPTPPNVYDLRMRESLFHGVRAIRLIPRDESKMYGRDGILAHSYMLGPNGQSNGCVSFSNYDAFLDAFQRGEVTRLVVVERLADVPSPKTASDWISDKLKDIFRRS